MSVAEEIVRAAAGQPDVRDSKGSVWTWRGEGYALASQPDTDWQGRPWTVTAATIAEKFGRWKGTHT